MTGGGFYDANSAPQWRATEAILPWLQEAAVSLPQDGAGPITLADFGCSEGRNSIAVMSQIVERLLPRTSRSIQTIHSDLPTNDFSNLFLGLRPAGQSVFGSERVFSAAVGGSMFDQLLASKSVHLAMTFNAIGFLSRRPVESPPGYILPNEPGPARANGYVSAEDQRTFAGLAQKDLARFLRARSHELVSGGKLLVQVFGAKGAAKTTDGIYDLLNDAVLDFVETGDIARDTYDRYYQPVYMRHLHELIAPVVEESHGVSELFSLDRKMDYEIGVPFNERFREDGNLERYATDYVNFFRAFTEAVLRNALPAEPNRDDLVEKIYNRAESRLKADPESYPFRYLAVAMLLTRTG